MGEVDRNLWGGMEERVSWGEARGGMKGRRRQKDGQGLHTRWSGLDSVWCGSWGAGGRA